MERFTFITVGNYEHSEENFYGSPAAADQRFNKKIDAAIRDEAMAVYFYGHNGLENYWRNPNA